MKGRGGVPWYLWLNVLNLDAPLITVAWQWLFARTAGYALHPAEAGALFLAVWIVYAGDRVLDGFRLSVGPTTAARHRFGQRHARALMVGIGLAGVVGAWLALTHLPLGVLAAGAGLGALVVGYFFWNQLAGTRFGRGWLKEVVVSLVFAGGAALVPLVNAFSWAVLGEAVGFAVVCFANCLLIARLERERDVARGETSIALRFGEGARPSLLVAGGLALVMLAVLVMAGFTATGVSLLASAALIAAAPWVERRLGADGTCAWADLALLTPLVAVAFA
jgi:hypothetical protein